MHASPLAVLKYKFPVYVHIVFENDIVRSAVYVFHFEYTGLRVRLHGHEGKNQNMTLAWGTTEILKYDLRVSHYTLLTTTPVPSQ